jgi:hypothetical protein
MKPEPPDTNPSEPKDLNPEPKPSKLDPKPSETKSGWNCDWNAGGEFMKEKEKPGLLKLVNAGATPGGVSNEDRKPDEPLPMKKNPKASMIASERGFFRVFI